MKITVRLCAFFREGRFVIGVFDSETALVVWDILSF
jgi:hypothetical protein